MKPYSLTPPSPPRSVFITVKPRLTTAGNNKAACLRAHDASLRSFLRANNIKDDVGTTPFQQLGQAYKKSYPKLPFADKWSTLLREVAQENCEQETQLYFWYACFVTHACFTR